MVWLHKTVSIQYTIYCFVIDWEAATFYWYIIIMALNIYSDKYFLQIFI